MPPVCNSWDSKTAMAPGKTVGPWTCSRTLPAAAGPVVVGTALATAHGRPAPLPALAAMAKNTATDACSAVCDQAVQIHGGYGYMREYVVERLYRDARLYPIGGGTREIMNEIIAKQLGM